MWSEVQRLVDTGGRQGRPIAESEEGSDAESEAREENHGAGYRKRGRLVLDSGRDLDESYREDGGNHEGDAYDDDKDDDEYYDDNDPNEDAGRWPRDRDTEDIGDKGSRG